MSLKLRMYRWLGKFTGLFCDTILSMETYTLTVVEPDAMHIINDLAKRGSVKLQRIKDVKRKSKSERQAFYLSAPVMTDEELIRNKEIKQWMNQWR